MQLQRPMTNGNSNHTRYSFPALPVPVPVQSPSLLMNKREQNRQSINLISSNSEQLVIPYQKSSSYREKRKSNNPQSMISSQKQSSFPSEEINILKEKLIVTENKVYKWKKEFKELQFKFMQILTENTKIKEELEVTRRMLEESEHIRSRWFIKDTTQNTNNTNSLPKKLPQHHQSHSLPSNFLRFLKLNNPRKSSSTTSAT